MQVPWVANGPRKEGAQLCMKWCRNAALDPSGELLDSKTEEQCRISRRWFKHLVGKENLAKSTGTDIRKPRRLQYSLVPLFT
jgi:hypothetical protein